MCLLPLSETQSLILFSPLVVGANSGPGRALRFLPVEPFCPSAPLPELAESSKKTFYFYVRLEADWLGAVVARRSSSAAEVRATVVPVFPTTHPDPGITLAALTVLLQQH
eukprot:GCRY01005948.1.p1 GENE.GCRY01005948.1~~GCRY01005948.1.p1  ORF type:complete len:110 (+),score=20.55 GCRY01005948.1:670-999(+)